LNDTTGRLYLNALQHDASTNPGNSGGGVFNLHGELLGLTALITTMHGTSSDSGVAFAIPSNCLPDFVKSALSGGTVKHGWLGERTFTQATEVNPHGWGRLRTVFGKMVAGGPGDSSGILPGDVIVKIDGKTVFGLHEVLALVDGLAPEAVIEVLINRGGIELPITVVVGQRSLRE
jgi:S1-C subfamily serine protease